MTDAGMRFVCVLLLVLCGTAAAEVAPPGWPADVPYLETEHGLSGQAVAWPSREMCTVITLGYDERMATLRTRMRTALTDAGWRAVRMSRGTIEWRRGERIVLTIVERHGRGSQLQLYDC